MAEPESGISVVVCCYNSAARLPETLAHLARQSPPFDWEIVLVDNASTDGTAGVARDCWNSQAAPLRIVHEPTPGLIHARRAGIAAARYDWIGFVDDDNWVCPGWLAVVGEIFSARPEVGACGGDCEPVFETPPPAWFAQHQQNFAVGPQGRQSGPVDPARGYLYGAGLSVRRPALQALHAAGFRSLLAGRTGAGLSSGEDVELCRALTLSGWTLWYDSRLRVRHFMTAGRLRWSYLRRLSRAMGASSVWLEAYEDFSRGRVRRSWVWQARCAAGLLWRNRAVLRSRDRRPEGDEQVLEAEMLLGRLSALLRVAFTYDRVVRSLESAPWRKARSPKEEYA